MTKTAQEKYSLAYFKGVFHTYAIQNDPGINVSYDFDIAEFDIENSMQTSIRTQFDEFQEIDIEFLPITKEDVEELVHRWFYAEFSPNYKKHIPTNDITNRIVNDLITCFKIKSFHKITSLKRNGKSVENEFGYVTDFIILASETKGYYCNFIIS